MAATDPTLQVIVELKDQMTQQFNTLTAKIDKNSGAMSRSFAKTGTAAAGLIKWIGGLAAAYVSLRTAQKLWADVKVYAKLETARITFSELGKQIGATTETANRWIEATKGTVGEVDLLTEANKAISAGMAQTEDQFTALSKAAVSYARVMNTDVTSALQSLIQSITSGTTRGLIRIGIDLQTEYLNKRIALGRELTLEEKQFIALEAVVKKFQNTEAKGITISEKLQQIDKKWGDAQENLGEAFAASSDGMLKIASTWETFTSEHKDDIIAFMNTMVDLGNLLSTALQSVVTAFAELNRFGKELGNQEWFQSILDAVGLGPKNAPKTNKGKGRPINDDPLNLGNETVIGKRVKDKLKDVKSWCEEATIAWNKFVDELYRPSGKLMTYFAELRNLASNVADTFINSFKAMENTLGDVFFDAMTGKMKSFKEYLKSFIEDISRELSRFASRQVVQALFGYSSEGNATGLISKLGSAVFTNLGIGGTGAGAGTGSEAPSTSAVGGITSGITIAGEAGPEAIVPLPGNRKIPVQMQGSGGRSVTVNFNISAADGPSVRAMLARERHTISKVIQEALQSDMQLRTAAKGAVI